ncbi:hypothetical protein [Gordonia aurantiaca]|uniref:hypothetical protein n=1 Tax=Gordonia sp. B21 TaxID=3151852 RepID=UPI003264378F
MEGQSLLNLPGANDVLGSSASGVGGDGSYRIETVEAKSAVSSIKGLVADMQAAVDRIARATDNSTASKQDADGKWVLALLNAHGDWNGDAVRMNQLLDEIRNALGFNFNDREDADAVAGNAFGSAPGAGTLA